MSPTEEETRRHIHQVQQLMYRLNRELLNRCEKHDQSKLVDPEKTGFEQMDAEPYYPYGSPEYFDKLERYRPILEHHYKNNSHHPEHYAGFIGEMDLLDIMEMLCDWASRREGLSIDETITLVEQQSERFNLPSILSSILLNTLKRYLATEFYDAPKPAAEASAPSASIATGTLRPSGQLSAQKTGVPLGVPQRTAPAASPARPGARPAANVRPTTNAGPAASAKPAPQARPKPPVKKQEAPLSNDMSEFDGLFSKSSIDLSALKEFGM